MACVSNFMLRSRKPSPANVWQSQSVPGKGVDVSARLNLFALGAMLPPTPSLRESKSVDRSTSRTSKPAAPFSAAGITPFALMLTGFGQEVVCMSRSGSPDGGGGSSMVIVWSQVDLSQRSAALHVRVMIVSPFGPTEMLSDQVVVIAPWQASMAVANPVLVGSVGSPGPSTRSGGQVISGGCVSANVRLAPQIEKPPSELRTRRSTRPQGASHSPAMSIVTVGVAVFALVKTAGPHSMRQVNCSGPPLGSKEPVPSRVTVAMPFWHSAK